MRSVRSGIRWLGAALLGLAGCVTSEPTLKPRQYVEEYRLPPSDDPRFSQYISYPKETLNTDAIKKASDTAGDAASRPQSRFSGGPGMGSGGY